MMETRCSYCGRLPRDHACAIAPTLDAHLSAAKFYGTCPGDPRVWGVLYPEIASR